MNNQIVIGNNDTLSGVITNYDITPEISNTTIGIYIGNTRYELLLRNSV